MNYKFLVTLSWGFQTAIEQQVRCADIKSKHLPQFVEAGVSLSSSVCRHSSPVYRSATPKISTPLVARLKSGIGKIIRIKVITAETTKPTWSQRL
jgi:hypothetical protein